MKKYKNIKWTKKVKCGKCQKETPKKSTKINKEGKRVCEKCFEKIK